MADLADLLAELRHSDVFAADFPKRRCLTHAEMERLSGKERLASQQTGLEAIARMKNAYKRLADIARRLGAAKNEEAVPTLASLWRNCALVPLRQAAGHALRTIGTPAARSVLVELLDDSDPMSVFMAVSAVFDAAPMKAYEKFISYFDTERVRQPGAAVVPTAVLRVFSPGRFSREGPIWAEPRAPQWLRDDHRWVDLCVRLRHDEILGSYARNVLRYVEPETFKSALADATKREGPRITKPRTQAFGDLVARYRAGEHMQVWQALRSFDTIAGDLSQEADAVADETMRRVAYNLDLLVPRFAAKGWMALSGKLWTRPAPDDDAILANIVKITKSRIPASLSAFWRVVGGVDLVWDYDSDGSPPPPLPEMILHLEALDPLYVAAPASIKYQFDEWEHAIQKTHPELLDPFSIDLAPDYLHKANVSGGAPYSIELPFFGADPIFQNEEHKLPFVDYLRHCFRWAGFGHLDHHAHENGVSELVATLTQGFEPF